MTEKFQGVCKNAMCNEDKIVIGAGLNTKDDLITGPWSEDLPQKERQERHSCGWNNAFAFPWEIGMYWNLTVGGVNSRAIGCPGLDTPYSEWPYR